ncbi:MAG TPA: AAA family ATPase [Terriglobales bacterium]|nr:AAA family ATPase [Terriglobales bacterium]
MQNSNLVVITGGPGSGKTRVLEALRDRGYICSDEVARRIIQQQVLQGGDALPWANRERYTQLMLDGSILAFQKHADSNEITFFDRGIPDTLCYARLIGFPNDEMVRSACRNYRYRHQVFFAPPWQEIYTTDAERKQDFEVAVRTAELMVKVYRECGYEIVDLPMAIPEVRAEFIVRRLEAG